MAAPPPPSSSSMPPPPPVPAPRPPISADELVSMMKRKATSAAANFEAKKAKRRKSAISGHDIRGSSKKGSKSSSSSSASSSSKRRPPLPPSLQPIYRPDPKAPPIMPGMSAATGQPLRRPASGFAPLSSGSFGPPSAGLNLPPFHPVLGGGAMPHSASTSSGFGPIGGLAGSGGAVVGLGGALKGSHWVREPLSRRTVSGSLLCWPVWVEVRQRAHFLQGLVPAPSSAPSAHQSLSHASSSSASAFPQSDDDEDPASDDSDADELAEPDDLSAHPTSAPTRSQFFTPLSYPASVTSFLQPARLDAEIERLEIKLLAKRAQAGDRETGRGRAYVDLDGGSRHMVQVDGVGSDKPPTLTREWSTSSVDGGAVDGASGAASGGPAFTQRDGAWVCSVCEKAFSELGKAQKHGLVHVTHRPFLCSICGAGFTLDFNRKTHERTHTGERPYTCPVDGCNRSFTQQSNLKSHEKQHEKEKQRSATPSPSDAVKREKPTKDEKTDE